jgi:glycosyltransferase involved in cell wall biosynthesis
MRRAAAPAPDPEPSSLVVVIPAYDEARAIGGVIARARAVARRIVVVDDGSTDATWSIVAAHPVHALRHAANLGKGAALLDGIRQALALGADRIVTLDADGQHRPEDIHGLVAAAARAPAAIVVGSRRADGRHAPRARYWANRIADFWISWAAGQRIEDTQSGFRLYPAAVVERLLVRLGRSRGFVLESELLIEAGRAGIEIVPVPIPALYDGAAQRASHFRPLRDIPRIVVMVAWKLLSRGMDPLGLWRMLLGARHSSPRTPAPPPQPSHSREEGAGWSSGDAD